MPEWTAPFQLPRFTTQSYSRYKANYIAKHGYTVYLPGLSDLIKIPVENPMTREEEAHWKAKDFGYFSPARLDEIEYMKRTRRERFEHMLSSPTPDIHTNYSSVMTALDNTEDALTTLSVVARVAIKFAPRALSRLLTGPVGWIMTASDCANFLTYHAGAMLPCMEAKREYERLAHLNPFGTTARLRRLEKLRRTLPSRFEFIEMAQTSKDLFGFGLCLGPIFGLLSDVIYGIARARMGQPVTWELPRFELHHWERVAAAAARNIPNAIAHLGSLLDHDVLKCSYAYHFATQVLDGPMRMWHPLREIIGLEDVEIPAPAPRNPLTREVIEEAGYEVDPAVNWAGSSRPWTTMDELQLHTAPRCQAGFEDYCERKRYDWEGFAAASEMTHACFRAASIAGEWEPIYYDEIQAHTNTRAALTACYKIKPIDDHPVIIEYIERSTPGRVPYWHQLRPPWEQVLVWSFFHSGVLEWKFIPYGVDWWVIPYPDPEYRAVAKTYWAWAGSPPYSYGPGFPLDWRPGDPIPDYIYIDEGTEFPPGWLPTDPVPAGVHIIDQDPLLRQQCSNAFLLGQTITTSSFRDAVNAGLDYCRGAPDPVECIISSLNDFATLGGHLPVARLLDQELHVRAGRIWFE